MSTKLNTPTSKFSDYVAYAVGLFLYLLFGAIVFLTFWNDVLDPLAAAVHTPVDDIKFSTAWSWSWLFVGLPFLFVVPVPKSAVK